MRAAPVDDHAGALAVVLARHAVLADRAAAVGEGAFDAARFRRGERGCRRRRAGARLRARARRASRSGRPRPTGRCTCRTRAPTRRRTPRTASVSLADRTRDRVVLFVRQRLGAELDAAAGAELRSLGVAREALGTEQRERERGGVEDGGVAVVAALGPSRSSAPHAAQRWTAASTPACVSLRTVAPQRHSKCGSATSVTSNWEWQEGRQPASRRGESAGRGGLRCERVNLGRAASTNPGAPRGRVWRAGLVDTQRQGPPQVDTSVAARFALRPTRGRGRWSLRGRLRSA